MSDLIKDHSINDAQLAADTVGVSEPDPFASLNKLLDENPEFKGTFDTVMQILGDNTPSDEDTEVECVEIDGQDYIVAKRIEIAGNIYLYLVNENDVLDFIIQKVIIEDGEEYIIGLDSDKEFDLVQAYLQRDFFMQLKGNLRKERKDTQGNQ